MKNIFRFPLVLLLLLAGCGEDYLAVSPEHFQSSVNFYKTKDQFMQAANAAYAPLQELYSGSTLRPMGSLWALAEMRSDNTSYHKNTGDASGFQMEELDEFREVANNTPVSNLFQGCYTGITRCNIILDRIDASSVDQATKDLVAGQASFLRAFYYFQLVRLYGDVPLVLKEVKSIDEAFTVSGPKPSSEIYTVIQSDAATAITKLPDAYTNASDKGRVTQGAARTLLAEVHMTLKNFTAATEQLRAVVQSAKYQLHASYASNFTLANENGIESIFEIQYIEGSAANEFSNFIYTFAPNGSGTAVAGFALPGSSLSGWNIPTQDLLDSYETNDARKAASIGSFTETSSGKVIPFVKKYQTPHAVRFQTGSNFPVYRYADVLLMLAECLNETGFVADGEAFQLLNQIRTRAGLPTKSTTATDPALLITTQEQFRDAIAHERQVELAFENHRWFDLLRTNKATAVMQAHGAREKAIKSYLNPASYNDIRLLNLYPQRELELLSR
jgi:hypothetical protein